MLLKFKGETFEIIDLLGGRRVEPGDIYNIKDSIAKQLLKTKRWSKDIKEKKEVKKKTETLSVPKSVATKAMTNKELI